MMNVLIFCVFVIKKEEITQPLQICIGPAIRIGQESWCLPYVGFFRVLMPRWEMALLLWDLFCSPGRIAWAGDIYTYTHTDYRLLDRISPVGQFGENVLPVVICEKRMWPEAKICMTRSENSSFVCDQGSLFQNSNEDIYRTKNI